MPFKGFWLVLGLVALFAAPAHAQRQFVLGGPDFGFDVATERGGWWCGGHVELRIEPRMDGRTPQDVANATLAAANAAVRDCRAARTVSVEQVAQGTTVHFMQDRRRNWHTVIEATAEQRQAQPNFCAKSGTAWTVLGVASSPGAAQAQADAIPYNMPLRIFRTTAGAYVVTSGQVDVDKGMWSSDTNLRRVPQPVVPTNGCEFVERVWGNARADDIDSGARDERIARQARALAPLLPHLLLLSEPEPGSEASNRDLEEHLCRRYKQC